MTWACPKCLPACLPALSPPLEDRPLGVLSGSRQNAFFFFFFCKRSSLGIPGPIGSLLLAFSFSLRVFAQILLGLYREESLHRILAFIFIFLT